MLNMNRSSCPSGSGYVPSCSMGFCVASTKNGFGSIIVSPLAVTECSCIAASRAAGDRVLLHRLERARLRSRRRAVDLVGQENVREHRSAHELEGSAAAGA